MRIADERLTCYICAERINPGERYARSASRRIVCLDCEDVEDDD